MALTRDPKWKSWTDRQICRAHRHRASVHGSPGRITPESGFGGDRKKPGPPLEASHVRWWHHYWHRVAGLMRLSSDDGTSAYLENLRTTALFASAVERGGVRPGSQGRSRRPVRQRRRHALLGPGFVWGWNLGMLVAANLGAGAFGNNDAYFRMYRDDLPTIKSWTAARGARPTTTPGRSAPAARWPSSSGRPTRPPATPASWRKYPVMTAWAGFMLAYAKVGPDSYLHTDPSNAHETQWDVHDPTTDVAATRAVFHAGRLPGHRRSGTAAASRPLPGTPARDR